MKLFEGSGNFRRDFIHVADTVKINLHFYESKSSGIFNAGTGKARSFEDIATTLQRLHGSGELETIPFPEDLRGKYQEFTEAGLNNLRQCEVIRRNLFPWKKGLGNITISFLPPMAGIFDSCETF